MRVLLDENLDHALRKLLAPHEVATVTYRGWAGLKNGELLQAAENDGFDVFLTATKRFRMSRTFPDAASPSSGFRPFNCRSYGRTLRRSLPPSQAPRPAVFSLSSAARSREGTSSAVMTRALPASRHVAQRLTFETPTPERRSERADATPVLPLFAIIEVFQVLSLL